MANKTKAERWAEIHDRALQGFNAVQDAQRDERLQCVHDRRFCYVPGAQWEGGLGQQFANKPRFEFNKIHLAVIRIINEYRNNRIAVSFLPRNPEDDDVADVAAGLFRADEEDSNANEAYDNAYEEGVSGGIGAWRLRACYEDEEDEEDDRQRIRFEPIFDADSCVFFDVDAKRQDKADAKKCWVLSSMSVGDFKDTYDEDPTTWPKAEEGSQFDWVTPDRVYVAEYYEVEDGTETFHIYRGLDGTEKRISEDDLAADDMLAATLEATGFRVVRQKKVKRPQVHKWIMSGGGILKDEGQIAGRHIPIIPFYGKRWFVDNIERCMGHVRLAKDAMRLKNMLVSKLAEISAYSGVEKPIFTPQQMMGHQNMWSEHNIEEYPYLLVNPVQDAQGNPMPAGPVAYTKPPSIPPALAALLQVTEQDIQDLLGNQQAGDEFQPNMSGKAVELIQNRLDMQSFIYLSNFSKAKKRCGEVWLSMAKDLYIEEGRRMKTVAEDGEPAAVELARPVYVEALGETALENDLTKAKLDVSVDVGPSSSSRRSATVRALTGIMQITQDPQTMKVLGAMVMMNMEGEGIGDARDYFRDELLRIGAVKPTKEEEAKLAAEQANQKPDANSAFLMAEAEKSQAQAALARANTIKAIAESENKKAETAKIISETSTENQKRILDAIGAFMSGSTPTDAASQTAQ